VAGVLPAAIAANARGHGLICPFSCGPEAAWASRDADILAPRSLIQLANHFKGDQVMARPEPAVAPPSGPLPDLRDIKGQESAKRVLEIAAGGRPQPPYVRPARGGQVDAGAASALDPAAARAARAPRDLDDPVGGGVLEQRRPLRPAPVPRAAPSASMAALVGGGINARPGEVSLAHRGVLFLDELPEFQPQVLDSLRQPLETGEVLIARANHRVTYPPGSARRRHEPVPLRPGDGARLRLPPAAERALHRPVPGAPVGPRSSTASTS
jgi:magnesium chelatase family protein